MFHAPPRRRQAGEGSTIAIRECWLGLALADVATSRSKSSAATAPTTTATVAKDEKTGNGSRRYANEG